LNLRNKEIEKIMTKHGIKIHFKSLRITFIPHSEKNFSTPIGDTLIFLKGKKKRSLSNGIKNPTPFPPDVIASKIPCEIIDRKITYHHVFLFSFPKMNMIKVAQRIVNTIECVKPRCPKGCS
jgi:hypothetical protein